ncbi:hypothetical protein HS088_TW03G01317 [Tripterygium wilfordii]|uniref:DUF3741 domain-containing protein n=1 Tax=Tripterygium wilfordii TaxID=458696 RepID=A0A7J7DY04_TRIWF|nr:uncharacterized protein LOC119989944 [Tripterygium wilfordii]XP_038691660.1 uncharacterized protein LOC119989944 [Tripterygium wilfordii]XP_038691665.1 uncharacterized protein LOC119989944 [Tripterygium wilfordii]KAF5750976.1 hypothetical protein HS088_TW03G01317 [Tripterygium wilfordii]
MSGVLESKRRSPSVIARLMGVDGLPPQQSTHKQNRTSGTYEQREASVEGAQRSDSWRSFRKTSKEEQEFKDVYEVLDSSNKESSCHSSRGASNSKLSEADMAFVRQKFMDAKRLATDEKLQDSQEFHDAIELLVSNKDLLLKFLQQPNSLFTKHLHDLQGSSPPRMTPQFHCGRISAMKSSHDRVNENIDLGCKTERKATRKSRSKSAQKHRDGFLGKPCNTSTAINMLKSSKVCLEGNDDSTKLPARIVVLKPNLGNIQNSARTAGSPRFPHAFLQDCSSNIELTTINNRDSELWAKKTLPDVMGRWRHESREISRKMKTDDSRFKTKGYAGDESSPNTSENESAYESGVRTLIARPINSSARRSSSSRSTKSSVSQEARRRLSERWKLTHNSQELGLSRRGSTLAEMLASPDCEEMPANLDTIIGEEGFSGSDRLEEWVEPLGISSRDGWKVASMTSLSSSRLRSLHAPSISFGSPKTPEAVVHRQSFRSDRYLMPKKPLNRERDKVVRDNFDQRDWSASRKSRSNVKKSQVSSSTLKESNDTAPCVNMCEYESKGHFRDDASFECDCVDSDKPISFVGDENYVHNHVVNVEIENKTWLLNILAKRC